MQRSSRPPDELISSLPPDVQLDMRRLDQEISSVMAGLERVVWEGPMWGGTQQNIVGYGAYRYVNRSGNAVDWFMVGLAAQKNHLSLYVNAVDGKEYLVKSHASRLGKVKVGSANVTFKRLADVDLDALRQMLARARELMTGDAGASA
ncbi:MAG TPA: DUF1801 domain-containing protein [Candidatus Limnocylindria bacterium]|nr:DUF1801 domain-containing protein [Candidatus Limnocylindria bacterium]